MISSIHNCEERIKIADIIDNMLKFAELEPTCDDEDEDTNRSAPVGRNKLDFALKRTHS
jgi:hypothetical protein